MEWHEYATMRLNFPIEIQGIAMAKALLVGINDYQSAPLRGCVNDVLAMREVLIQSYGLNEHDLRVLQDGAATKAAIVEGLRWLAEPDPQSTTRLFHFSGHGTFVADQNGDEPDGRDECICPVDYETTGPMNDDTLRDLYRGCSPDTHLLLMMDCCHSGTVQRDIAHDVRYRFLPASYDEEQRIRAAARQVRDRRDAYVIEQLSDMRDRAVPQDEWERRIKEAIAQFDKKHFGQDEVPGQVVLLAACRADQTAADASLGGYHGAFSYYLVETLRSAGGRLAYGALIEQVGRTLYDRGFAQEPQLECSAASRECPFLNLSL
jgi:uncharacterized caspase-like protein